MQTLKEKLDEIMLNTDGRVSEELTEYLINFFQDEIEKCVPEKVRYPQVMSSRENYIHSNGYDKCREEILQNLKAAGLTK